MTVDLHEHPEDEPAGPPRGTGAGGAGVRVQVDAGHEREWEAREEEAAVDPGWVDVQDLRPDPLAELDWFPTPDQVSGHLPCGPWDDGGALLDLDNPQVAAAWAATDPLAGVWSVSATAGVPVRGGPVLPDRVADVCAGLAPGLALARVIEDTDLALVDDAGLVEFVDAVTRQEARLHARKAAAAAELSRRESMNPMWSPAAGDPPTQGCIAGDELAMRLACSRRLATRLVAHGRAYAGVLSATGDALAAGDLDVGRAQVITDRLANLPAVTALDVQACVLPEAPRRTLTQLRRDLERALINVDTAEAERRRAHAVTTRRVEHPRVLPDGMAGLWAVLPAGDAARIDTTLDAAARTARAAGDPRTLDQLRADGLRDLLLHTTTTDATGSTSTPGTSSALGSSFTAGSAAVAAADTPGTAGVFGTPHVAGTPGFFGIAGATGAVGAADVAGATGPDDLTTSTATTAAAGHGPCGCSRVRASRRTQVRVTVPLSTLIGTSDAPGELGGYGPIDATTARALAEGGIWRRLITDPTSGTVLDVGRTTYRPPAGMVEHVQARDQVCARPGCSTAAEACDLDHTREYHPPPSSRPPGGLPPGAPPGSRAPAQPLGTTAAHNLGPLCRRDHRLKTDGGMRLTQVAPGVFEWTTTTGHRYRVVPGDNGANQHLGYAPPPF